jgi:hypothetical protein
MEIVGFAGFFILVTLGCVVALGLAVAENWQRIVAAITGSDEAVVAARSFTTTQCSPVELPSVAQRMVLHELDEEFGEVEEPAAIWIFERMPRRSNQMAFRFA